MWKRSNQKRELTCGQVKAQLLAYFDQELPADRQQAVREHLAICDTCARLVREAEMLEADLFAGAGRYRPLLSSQAAARIQKQVYRRMRRGLIMQRATRFTARAAGVAAVLALLVGLFALWQGGLLGEETAGHEQDDVTVITFACEDYERDKYEKLAQDFHAANPDIRVQLISASEASGQQREGSTVTTDGREFERLASAADTFVWYAWLRSDDWSFLLDLGPFVDDPSFPVEDFLPGTLDHYRWQGEIYGLPAEILPLLIFYDKKMFDEAELPYAHIGWTWDDFLQAATQLTEREGDTVKRYGFVDSFFYNTVYAMMHQHGVLLWDDQTDPPQPLFDTPQVADILSRYTDMALGYEIMPVPEIGSNVMASNLINEGKAAMWTGFAYDLDYHAHRTDLGLAPYPKDVNAANPRSMYGFFASAGTAHPEAAWRWLAYLSANYQPFRKGTLPGRRSVAERLPWWRKLDEETKAIFEHALAYPPPPDSPPNRLLLSAVVDVFEDGASVEGALATAQTRALAMQSELARTRPPAPQPVATPQPLPSEGQTVITFAPFLDTELPLYKELAASFRESHPDVWVEVAPAHYSLTERAATSDCFGGRFSIEWPGVRQEIRSLQPFLDADASFDLADYHAPLLDAVQQDGELWALPYEADALMVYVNLDRFTQAGLVPPEPGWSLEEFLDAAVTLSGADQYGFTTREGAYGDLVFVLERMGARLVDNSHEPPTPTLDDPTVVAALERFADLSRGGALTPATPSAQSGWPDAIMLGPHPPGVESGQVAMWVDSIYNQVFAPPLSFDTGVLPLPVGTQASTEFSVSAYYISAHTPAPQACWEWLSFLGDQPETVQLLPARRSGAASPLWRERAGEAALPAYRATLEYDDVSLFRLRSETLLGYTYPWLDEAFQAVVGGEDAKLALGEAQAKAEMYVACLEAAESPADQLRACAQQVDPNYPLAGTSQ